MSPFPTGLWRKMSVRSRALVLLAALNAVLLPGAYGILHLPLFPYRPFCDYQEFDSHLGRFFFDEMVTSLASYVRSVNGFSIYVSGNQIFVPYFGDYPGELNWNIDDILINSQNKTIQYIFLDKYKKLADAGRESEIDTELGRLYLDWRYHGGNGYGREWCKIVEKVATPWRPERNTPPLE